MNKTANEMQVFQNSEFGELGVLEIDGKPYFPATTCAKILGYSNPRKAILDHCKEDGVTKRDVIDSMGRTQYAKFITEGNLYRLITHSKLPAAERFEKWVFDEVLPSIRQTGSYSQPGAAQPFTMEQMAQFAAAVAAQVVTQIVPIIVATIKEAAQPAQPTAPAATAPEVIPFFTSDGPAKCKLETFPPDIVRKVEEMLTAMEEQQNLNFSMIARFCTINGYTISSPAVKTYYQRHFTAA